ncbi:MAG: methanethiol S-methyltransferase [Phycisphaerae bacterium]
MSTQTLTWTRTEAIKHDRHVDRSNKGTQDSIAPKETTKSSGCPLHNLLNWEATGSLASRVSVFAFGLIAYFAFFGTICYAMGFVNNVIVPKSISSGEGGRLLPSLLINGAFLMAFAVQHTIMARKWFKQWVTRFIPTAMERSLFVILASAILAGMFACWQPLPYAIWEVTHPVARWSLIGLSFVGWAIVFYSTFIINHFDLFGLRQITINLMGGQYRPVNFQLKGMYRFVRHPLMLGFLIAFWATPLMTVGHLFFAVMTTGYILFGVAVEERDLVADFGEEYLAYRRQVPAFFPISFGKSVTTAKGGAA